MVSTRLMNQIARGTSGSSAPRAPVRKISLPEAVRGKLATEPSLTMLFLHLPLREAMSRDHLKGSIIAGR